MPIKRCGDDGYKWGDTGKCYTGPDAKKKAIKQGIAIEGPKKFSEKASEEGLCLSQEEISFVSDQMYEQNYSLAAIVDVTTSLASHDYEEITEDNFYVPAEEDYFSVGDDEEEWDWAANRPGLWENIRRKKMREGDNYKPAKKGDKDRPDPEAWKRAQSKELQKDVYDNPGEAMKRAKELGLDGIHDHPSKKDPDKKVYMPGKTHDEYEKALREEMSKAKFAYKDPFTGEMFYFERPGVYKKNGRMLVKADHAQADKPKKDDPRRTPAPKKDQKKGSKKNKPDSAKDDKGKIKFSKEVTAQLEAKVKEHNAKGKGSKATLGMLKAVYRRGAGAYSSSHAPKMSRHGWAIARVNAFLTLLRTGKPSNSAYTQDNDLLPSSHPRSSKAAMTEKQKRALDKDKDGKITKKDFEMLRKSEGYGLPKDVVERELKKGHAAEYQGRKVTLNKPFRTPDGPKKSAVYVMGPKGKVVIVRFGDPNMKIKKSDPARRKSFRARHNCDNPGPKWKARYWSCRAW